MEGRIGRRREDAVRRAEADDSPGTDVGNTVTAEDMMNMIDPSASCIDCACGDASRGEEIEPWILEGRENVPAWVTTCCIQPALCVVDLPRRVKHWKTKLDIWEEGTAPIAACDHAMVMQGNMNDPGHQHQLNLPGCGRAVRGLRAAQQGAHGAAAPGQRACTRVRCAGWTCPTRVA